MKRPTPGGVDRPVVVALDVGTTKICALVGEVDESGAVHVLGIGAAPSEGLRKGVVVDIDSAARNIRSAVEAAQQDSGVEVSSAVVGITGDHVSCMNSQASIILPGPSREIGEQDLRRVLENARAVSVPPGREVIHVLPRGFSIDGQEGVRHPVGMCGNHLSVETHIIMAATSFVQNVVRSVQHAGLSVEAVVLEPVASSEAVLAEAEKELGVLVADIGGGPTDLAVVIDGAVAFSAAIPVGGNHVTNDLAVGLKVSRQEAERLKLNYGSAYACPEAADALLQAQLIDGSGWRQTSKRAIVDIIEPRMRELFVLMRDQVAEAGYGKLLSGVVLSGGGSLLAGAPELAESVMALPVRIGRPRNIAERADELASPVFATAVGLLYFAAARRYRVVRESTTHVFLNRVLDQFKNWIRRLSGR